MSGASRYRHQILESARLVADATGRQDWAVVFQSRSGRPEDPWLGPDVCEYLRDANWHNAAAVVLAPIGFVCDHIEVLYDLDVEAAQVCREIGLPMVRAETVNDDPIFLDMMADVVLDVWRKYERGRPLPLAPVSAPERLEGPPPRRGNG
jgi:ferrochelatase